MKYDEYDQQMRMRKMKAMSEFSHRVLNSYNTPNANTFAFTGMYKSPSGTEIASLYDSTNPLNYIVPANVSNTMNVKISELGVNIGTDFSVELFGYIIVKTSSAPTEVSVSVSNIDPISYTVRTWYGTNAIHGYTTSNTQSSVKAYHGEIIPVRIHVYLKANATKVAKNTPEANEEYWNVYQDVKRAKFPAWLHFDNYGRREGRTWPDIEIVDNFQVSVSVLSQFSKPDDVVGIYTLLDENNVPYFMNKYLYGLSGKDCYAISTNTQPEDVKYVLEHLYEVEVDPADLSNSTVTLSEIPSGFKIKIGNSPEVSKVFNGIVPQTNPDRSSGFSGSGDINQNFVFSSPSAYYMAKRVGTKTYVLGYLLNPKCDSSAAYPTTTDGVKMYNLDITPSDNRYGAYNKEISSFHPISDKDAFFKNTVLTMSGDWVSLDNLYPASLSGLSQINNATNEDKCTKRAANRGASQAFFVQDSTNPKSVQNLCYYTTETPAYGKVTLDTPTREPPANITSSLYIRTQADSKGSMPKLSVSNYSIGNSYEPTIAANREWIEIANAPYMGENFVAKKESFVEGVVSNLDKGIEVSQNVSDWANNSLANEVSSRIMSLNSSLTTLTTGAATKNASPVTYSNTDGVSYEEAKTLYNLVHPNTQKTAIHGLQEDSDELRMQYNNLLVVGSIAATTFAIAAIVTLSFR
jgi:hypothetical protein